MEKQQDIIGYIGLGISGVGAVASVITNNIAFASLPLTIGVGCNLLSRKQYNDSLVEAYNQQQQTLDDLIKKIDSSQTQINEQLLENRRESGNLIAEAKESINKSVDGKFETVLKEQKQELLQEIKRLDLQYQELNQIVSTIEQVENVSQNTGSEDNSAQFYYDRGVGYEKLGNKEGAIKDFSEAIKQDSALAKAYHRRGVIYLDQGKRQKAVDDLRKAALLYFEQGDIEGYQQAREMSRGIHDLGTANNNGKVKQRKAIVGSDLFS